MEPLTYVYLHSEQFLVEGNETMVALPAVPKVIKIILKHALEAATTEVINRIFMQYSGTAPTDTELNTFCSNGVGAWETNLEPMATPQVALTEFSAEDLTSPTSAVGAFLSAGVGTRTGGLLGAGTAATISFQIARRYRGGHPRIYTPYGSDSDLQDRAQWTSDFANDLGTAWVAFITALETSPWSGSGSLVPVNVSYYEGFTNHTYPSGRTKPIPNLRGTPIVDVIPDVSVGLQLTSQRRRNRTP